MCDALVRYQTSLLVQKQPFFAAVAKEVRSVIPSVTSIWCFGLNAMNPGRLNPHDWDFIAMVPASVSQAEVMDLNDLNSPLANLRQINGMRLDVQALRIDETSCFAQLLRKEGFVIWRDGAMVDPNANYLAQTA